MSWRVPRLHRPYKGQGWLDILRLITGGAVTAHKYIET